MMVIVSVGTSAMPPELPVSTAAIASPEDGISPLVRSLRPVVEERIVRMVDEELCRRAVRSGGARHGDRATLAHRHVGLVTAGLNHEIGNHPVEDQPVVIARLRVRQEVLHAEGCLVGIETDQDVPFCRFQEYTRSFDFGLLHGAVLSHGGFSICILRPGAARARATVFRIPILLVKVAPLLA
jgi:hypothetical protein